MDGILKVTPEKLCESADEFGMIGSEMKSLMDEMMNLVNALKGTWLGEASEAYSGKFQSLQSDMDKLHRMVSEHAKDLSEMAVSYKEAENANAEKGNSMLSGVID